MYRTREDFRKPRRAIAIEPDRQKKLSDALEKAVLVKKAREMKKKKKDEKIGGFFDDAEKFLKENPTYKPADAFVPYLMGKKIEGSPYQLAGEIHFDVREAKKDYERIKAVQRRLRGLGIIGEGGYDPTVVRGMVNLMKEKEKKEKEEKEKKKKK